MAFRRWYDFDTHYLKLDLSSMYSYVASLVNYFSMHVVSSVRQHFRSYYSVL